MTNFTKETVDAYADSLLIGLTPEENELVLNEFKNIKAQMDLISTIPNISKVEPLIHPFDHYTTTLREDEAEEGIIIESLFQNVDETIGREIKIPRVVNND